MRDFAFDDALLGVSEDNRAVYDYGLMVEHLCQKEGWTEEEAIDWIEYNVIRALPYMGSFPPVILHQV